jgi:hypothetical protein
MRKRATAGAPARVTAGIVDGMNRVIAFFTIALAIGASACSNSPSSPSRSSTLSLKVTDSPFSDAKAVFVTFSAVSLHRTDSDFTTLGFSGGASSRTCDLKKLEHGADDVLGTAALAPGDYTQVRLTISAATLYFDNASNGAACAATLQTPAGNSAAVTIPSGIVRLNRPFTVSAASATTMLLDVDGDNSIHATANGYTMNPVIEVVSVQ